MRLKVREFIYGVRLQWQRRFAEWLERGPLAPLYSKVNGLFWRVSHIEETGIPSSLVDKFDHVDVLLKGIIDHGVALASDTRRMATDLCDDIRKRTRQTVEVIVEYEVRGAVGRLAEEVKALIPSRHDLHTESIEEMARVVFAHNGSIRCLTQMITDLCVVAGVRPKLDMDGNYVGLEPTTKPVEKKRSRRSKKA